MLDTRFILFCALAFGPWVLYSISVVARPFHSRCSIGVVNGIGFCHLPSSIGFARLKRYIVKSLKRRIRKQLRDRALTFMRLT